MKMLVAFLMIFVLGAPGVESPSIAVVHLVGLDYPTMAHMAGVQGEVRFVLTIGESGAVEAVETVSGNGLLVGPSADSLRKWRFTRCKGKGEQCKLPIFVEVELKGGPVNLSQAGVEFEFDPPGHLIVRSKFAKAILD